MYVQGWMAPQASAAVAAIASEAVALRLLYDVLLVKVSTAVRRKFVTAVLRLLSHGSFSDVDNVLFGANDLIVFEVLLDA